MNLNFFRRSVASITASLTRMVSDLEQHAEAMFAEAQKQAQRSVEIAEKAKEARAEQHKALQAAEKIKSLLG